MLKLYAIKEVYGRSHEGKCEMEIGRCMVSMIDKRCRRMIKSDVESGDGF
jgi:hypothetical protein